MQKRIKLESQLKDKHSAYPEAWNILLKSLDQRTPILDLYPLGSISLIEDSFYFHLDKKYTKKWIPLIPEVDMCSLWAKASVYSVNLKQVSEIQMSMLQWIINYFDVRLLLLKRLISGAFRSLYLYVIDMGAVGKLIITRHGVQYLNQQHNWKYQFSVQRVELPRLLCHQIEEKQENIKIGRKFSLSIQKKYHSQSKDKKKDQSRVLRRSLSSSKIVKQGQKTKLKTQADEIALSFYPKMKKHNKMTSSLEKLKIQSRQHSKTEVSEEQKSKKLRSIEKDTIQTPYFQRQASKTKFTEAKYTESSFKLKTQKGSEKSKLKLDRQPRSLVPKERERLTTDLKGENRRREREESLLTFISDHSRCVFYLIKENKISKIQLNRYFVQMSHIFENNFQEIVQRRNNKTRFFNELLRQLNTQKMKKIQLSSKIPILTPMDQQNFTYFYKLVQKIKNSMQLLSKQYLVDYDLRSQMIQKFTKQLRFSMETHHIKGKILIQTGLLLHEFFQGYCELQCKLITKFVHGDTKIVKIKIKDQQNFDRMAFIFLQSFSKGFNMIKAVIKQLFPQYLHLQPHEIEKSALLEQKLKKILENCKDNYEENLSILRTKQIKNLFTADITNLKKRQQIIIQLEGLKQQTAEQINFKAEITVGGLKLDMSEIKAKFLRQIQSKIHQIFKYYLQIYLSHESELNSKLREIIVVNIDFLNDIKCQEYRSSIESNYNSMVDSMMFIMEYFFAQLEPLKLKGYLDKIVFEKKRIHDHFCIFHRKLQEYRDNSTATLKILQEKNKENKKIFQELNQKLKILEKQLTNEKSILDNKQQILRLNSQFEEYNKQNQQIVELMIENEMIFWQDDTFFETQMDFLQKSLSFLESYHYKVLFLTPAAELTIQKFYSSFEYFRAFIQNYTNSKMDKLFNQNYTLILNSLTTIEIFLYQRYSSADLQRFQQLNIDIESERNTKLFAIVKKYDIFDKQTLEKMKQIYQDAKLHEYNAQYQFNPNNLSRDIITGPLNIPYISNSKQIISTLKAKNQRKFADLISRVTILSEFYNEIVSFTKMINLISSINLNEQSKKQITSAVIMKYEEMLSLEMRKRDLDHLRIKIQGLKVKYLQLLYKEKINIFPRYCLHDFGEILALSSWDTKEQIEQNMRILYGEVDSVVLSPSLDLESIVIGRDVLSLETPLKISSIDGEKTKAVYLTVQNLLRSSLTRSEYASAQIKILTWFIYYTQQVQISLMTELPFSKLKEGLHVIISELSSQIRYDIKKHHKEYEISQLSMFLGHLEKIKSVTDINDFEWVSTVRFYDKARNVKVRQYDRQYDYGFTPKAPITVDPYFKLNTCISYGFKQSTAPYKISAYLLGQPFASMKNLQDYGFQQNYKLLLSNVKKFGYFLKIIVDKYNVKNVNYLHKQIMEISSEKEKETVNLPIFFEYSLQSAYPFCFPEKNRDFSGPELRFNIKFILLLNINKYSTITDEGNINLDILQKILDYVNAQKHLNTKEINTFVETFVKFLSQNSLEADIYKFCFKYLMTNFQLETPQLSALLKELVNKEQSYCLQEINNVLRQSYEDFVNRSTKNLVIYGPLTTKTHFIKSLELPPFSEIGYSIQNNQIYTIQGLGEYLRVKNKYGTQHLTHRLVIEDRYIWNIDPSQLSNCQLQYVSELKNNCIEQIFKEKMLDNKIEGNHVILWKLFCIFQNSYCEIEQKISTLAMIQLVTRAFHQHVGDFAKNLEESQRETLRIPINKETLRTFIVIVHQIYYYLVKPQSRKKFNEKITKNSLLDDFRNEELSSLTCKGITCQKIINSIKRSRNLYLKMMSFPREVLIAQKYLRYNENIIIDYKSHCSLQMIQEYICGSQKDTMKIVINANYTSELKRSNYKGIIYLIEDIHMMKKKQLTHLKSFQESQEDNQFILATKDSSYVSSLKSHITFRISDVEIGDVFKHQTKENILDNIHQKSKFLWGEHYFQCFEQYLSFLVKTTIKLPAQFYRKFYARELIYCKLSLGVNCLKTIKASEAYLNQTINFNSEHCFLVNHHSSIHQMSQMEIAKKELQCLQHGSYLQKIIVKEFYKQVLPYALTDRIYVIVEEIYLLPVLMAQIKEIKLYRMNKQECFLEDLIAIMMDVYISESEFMVVIEEPLASSSKFLHFFDMYLRQINMIKYYEEFNQQLKLLIVKQEYIYRNKNQEFEIQSKLLKLLYKRMKLVISVLDNNKNLYQIGQCYKQKVAFLNCLLDPEHRISISKLILERVLQNQDRNIVSVLKEYQDLFFQLTATGLIPINKFEYSLLECIQTLKTHFSYQKKKTESIELKKNFLILLKQIKVKLTKGIKQKQSIMSHNRENFDDLMQVIKSTDRPEYQLEQNRDYFEHQERIKQKFFSLHDRIDIVYVNEAQKNFYDELKSNFFGQRLIIVEDYVLLEMSTEQLSKLLEKRENSKAVDIFDKYNRKDVQEFILFKYFKYILNIIEKYQKIQYDPLQIEKETKDINYFYLLDISIELRKKYERQSLDLEGKKHQLQIVEEFVGVFVCIEEINLYTEEYNLYEVFSALKKIVRNHSIQSQTSMLSSIIASNDQKFTRVKGELDSFLLHEQQKQFESYNEDLLIKNEYLLIYDPYWKIQAICSNKNIQIIYIKQESDLQFMNEYRFGMTVYCIRINDLQGYQDNKKIIAECKSKIKSKNKDLQNNMFQKLAICFDDASLLGKIQQNYTMLNLGFTLFHFYDLVDRVQRKNDAEWKSLKEEYMGCKAKLKNEISLIQKLSEEQIGGYFLKIQYLIHKFVHVQNALKKMSSAVCEQQQKRQNIERLFSTLRQLQQSNQVDFSYWFRKLQKAKISELISICSPLSSDSQIKENVRTTLLNLQNQDLKEELTECLQYSRFVVILYEYLKKDKIKEMLQLQETEKYSVRMILEKSQEQIEEFYYKSSQKEGQGALEVVLIFTRVEERQIVAGMMGKCGVIRM